MIDGAIRQAAVSEVEKRLDALSRSLRSVIWDEYPQLGNVSFADLALIFSRAGSGWDRLVRLEVDAREARLIALSEGRGGPTECP